MPIRNSLNEAIDQIKASPSNLINWLKEDRRHILYFGILILTLYLLRPFIVKSSSFYEMVAWFSVYFILVISLNLQYGYAGVPNFGMVLPFAGGAYVAGALAGRFAIWYYKIAGAAERGYITDNTKLINEVNIMLETDLIAGFLILSISLIVAIFVGFALGYIASRPAIRLRADYLIIVLMTMGEAMRIIGTYYEPLVGATLYVSMPDIFKSFGAQRTLIFVLLFLVIAFIVFFVVQTITSTPFGRLLKSVRENEDTAESIGKGVIKIKTKVIMIGSSIAAIAGVLWAFHTKVVQGSAYTRSDWTFWPWLMVMIGGMASNRGTIAGAGGVAIFRRLLAYYKHDINKVLNLPFNVVWLEQILLGGALLLFIMYKPSRLIPEERMLKMRGINIKEYENVLAHAKSKTQ